MSPKVIFIDWDGTLSKSRFWEHWLSEDPESYNKIQDVLFIGNPGMIHDWMRGYVSAERVVSEISYRTGLDHQYLMSGLEKSCRAMVLTHPKVLDIVKEKREQGIKILIATDNMDTFSRWTVPSLDLEQHFDGILISVDRSALKEDVTEDGVSPFFHHYLSQNVIKPNECLIIDDRDLDKVTKRLKMNFLQVTPSFNIIDALQIV